MVIRNVLQDAQVFLSQSSLMATLWQVENDEYWDDNKSPRDYGLGINCNLRGQDLSLRWFYLNLQELCYCSAVHSECFLYSWISDKIKELIAHAYCPEISCLGQSS